MIINMPLLRPKIRAYLDDSGDSKRDKHVACGGIAGSSDMLPFFEVLWEREVEGLSEPFRSTECECQQGQFKAWTKPECDALITRLVDLMASPINYVGLIGTAVSVEAYHDIFPGSTIGDPYRFTLLHVLINLGRMARRIGLNAEVCFEEGTSNADVTRTYEAVRNFTFPRPDERGRLVGLSFGTKNTIPLQAADFAARECFKAAINRGVRRPRIPIMRMWNFSGMAELGVECLTKLKALGSPLDVAVVNALGSECFMEYVKDNEFSINREPV